MNYLVREERWGDVLGGKTGENTSPNPHYNIMGTKCKHKYSGTMVREYYTSWGLG
jgi:hypothetical protein